MNKINKLIEQLNKRNYLKLKMSHAIKELFDIQEIEVKERIKVKNERLKREPILQMVRDKCELEKSPACTILINEALKEAGVIQIHSHGTYYFVNINIKALKIPDSPVMMPVKQMEHNE